jgi:serine/threonine-protein kinase
MNRSESAANAAEPSPPALDQVGRYILHPAIARGGMATVHAARLVAAEGVTRLVAAKRLHPHYTDDPEFVAMFHDEARIASRIHHPNVVPVLDVIQADGEVILVQEYVHGVPLSHLFKIALASEPIPVRIVTAIVAGILSGLHAAHEATDELGEPLGVVHRDVSPQNVIVSVDGIPRLVDFGIAKAKTCVHHTREGFFKGKLAYMAPEQIRAEPVTRQVDIYAAGVVLWELLVNRRFYDGKSDADFVRAVALGSMPTVTQALEAYRETLTEERWTAVQRLEPIVARAMATEKDARWPTALEMAEAIVTAAGVASVTEVAAWVRSTGADYLEKRQRMLLANEETYRSSHPMAVASRSDGDDSMKSSGPRMRLGQGFRGEAVSLVEPPTVANVEAQASGLTVSTTLKQLSRLDQKVEARTLVPWTVVAGLLVIVGLLTGMVIVRAPSPAIPASSPAVVFAAQPPATTPAKPPPAPEPSAVAAPVTARPTATATATSSPTPASPPAPVVRWSPPRSVSVSRPAPPPPPPTPTPAAPSARPDCNPPFYFEGTKKIFKPTCL